MPETLKNFDWERPSELTTSEKAVYPWEDWLNGDIWQLTYGQDFQTHPLMMERIIRTRATGRKARVRMRHLPMDGDQWGIIVLQRTDITGPAQAKREDAARKRREKKEAAEAEAAQYVKAIKPQKTVAKKPAATPSKRVAKKQLAAVG